MKKYEFVENETKQTPSGVTLHRIRATRHIYTLDGETVAPGDCGGWIEKEENLPQDGGEAWVSDEACVYGHAVVIGDALICGEATVSGNASVIDNARIGGKAIVTGDAQVSRDAIVWDNAKLSGHTLVTDGAFVTGDATLMGDVHLIGSAVMSGGLWENSPIQIRTSTCFLNMASYTALSISGIVKPVTEWYANNFEELWKIGGTATEKTELLHYVSILVAANYGGRGAKS